MASYGGVDPAILSMMTMSFRIYKPTHYNDGAGGYTSVMVLETTTQGRLTTMNRTMPIEARIAERLGSNAPLRIAFPPGTALAEDYEVELVGDTSIMYRVAGVVPETTTELTRSAIVYRIQSVEIPN